MIAAGPSRVHPLPRADSRSRRRHRHPSSPPPHPSPRGKHPKPSAPAQPHVLPPSPPRSRREPSETPSLASGGIGKGWDEELPAPPASLSSILDAFRRSGDGDRELLLSILDAKKAEEERLTALIQTRLLILQARLSLHTSPPPSASSPASFSVRPEPKMGYMAPPLTSKESFDLSPPPGYLLDGSAFEYGRSSSPHRLAPLKTAGLDFGDEGEVSTGRPMNGLEMLLDAGMGRERNDRAKRE